MKLKKKLEKKVLIFKIINFYFDFFNYYNFNFNKNIFNNKKILIVYEEK